EVGRLPLTGSGKVDRAALQALGPATPYATAEYVAPQNAEQEVMAGIWSGLLGVERVGIFDDFFELGGHSLLSVRLLSRIYATFDVQVPLQSLFETPTVAGLTEKVQAARWAAGEPRPPGGVPSLREVGEL
ncbi:MAG TPA: phosphopantetheine-binding protein, partial [Pyrinomonadaceae bacterium]